MPHEGSGRRSGEYTCRCPACDYEMSVDEGQKCDMMDCPRCRAKMRAISTGEYHISGGISEAPSMGVAILGLTTIAGIALWAISKKV